MEVILLERVEKLGAMGETVTVRNGYGRNYLLARGKALRVTKANMARFEAERAVLEARNAEARDLAAEAAKAIDGAAFVIIRQASETGNLYGSVSTRDVADAAVEAGYDVKRSQVALDAPVKELGLHEVRVILHPEVDARVTVNVARSQDEAEIQASGKSVSELRAEEEAREAAEAAADFEGGQFDVDALFEDPRGDRDDDNAMTGEEEDPPKA